MKLPIKEAQILNILIVLFAGYDFFSLPFNSFLITLVSAIIIYALTKSPILVGSVLLAPQFIRLMNTVILGKKESFIPTNPTEVIDNVKRMKTESFTDLKEVSDRVVKITKENKLPDVEKVSGVVDETIMPTVDSIAFLEQFENRTDLTENTRIMTMNETSFPREETTERNTRSVANVEGFDTQTVNTALVNSMNSTKPLSSNIDSLEVSNT